MRRPLLALAALILVVAAACGDDGGSVSSTTAGPGAGSTSTTGVTPTTGGAGDIPEVRAGVLVYFVAGEAVATAGRTVATDESGRLRGALEALLAGPEGIETEIGMGTEIPAGTELLGVDLAPGVAEVDLSGAFATGGGSLSMQLRAAQVVFTLTQFETVDRVELALDGVPVEVLGGEGVPVDGVDRTDFEDVTPLILVESPVPGQAVSSPLEISGMSNTFEATVQYTVTDGEGLIVDQGFTTATAGNGTFGTFSVRSEFQVERPGVGSVIAFETSPRDGSQVNVYEVPVQVD